MITDSILTPVEWKYSGEIPYLEAIAFMEDRLEAVYEKKASELLWLLEHPSLYTAGATAEDAIIFTDLPIYTSSRGGKYTYHGPGQRIIYMVLDIKTRSYPHIPDIRSFIVYLENWIIRVLQILGIQAYIHPEHIGVWVHDSLGREAKIASIGIKIRKNIAYHGIALNVHPILEYFDAIIPCGIKEAQMTSLEAMGISVALEKIDQILYETWYEKNWPGPAK